eukprot:scaffold26166_cov147-Cylindrotheca_fusiformis.AAC.1
MAACGWPVGHSLSSYLDSLSSLPDEAIPPRPPSPEDIVPEEYYGLTNPMANNWPGSKHEKYGGYFHKLLPKTSTNKDSTRKPTPSPQQNHFKPNDTSSRKGSYLDNLGA